MPRWNSCNVLQAAPDASRLWHFEVKSSGPVLSREARAAADAALPAKFAAKSWTSLWQPKLNIAWLPPENVFLRVIELPQSNFEETLAMAELQLEKLSPMPVAQIVWTIQILPPAAEHLQTVIVVIVERGAVEKFLGQIESRGFLADRLEAPMLDELQAAPATENGAWIYSGANKNAALIAWWFDGGLRNLSFIVLPPAGDRVKNLKDQLAQLVWAGELEGWLTGPPGWHLVAEDAAAGEWETLLRESLGEPVQLVKPSPITELAARTARRATRADAPAGAALLPAEFSTRYRQQFTDRLWLHGLAAAGILYAVGVVIYLCATYALGIQTQKVERQVAAISGSYTNALQIEARYNILKERQDLKFAALDCLKIVAEQLPPDVSLQRFSFADGQSLSLGGEAPPDAVSKLFDFNSGMQKAKVNDQPMFSATGGDPLNYHQAVNNTVSWNFSLKLQRAAEEKP